MKSWQEHVEFAEALLELAGKGGALGAENEERDSLIAEANAHTDIAAVIVTGLILEEDAKEA